MNAAGTLYVVATPIGNLEDITLRAIRVLNEVDLIGAEDTRHSRKLLNHFAIPTPVVSYHRHNEAVSTKRLLAKLAKGQSIALICDAGTPGISDPGALVVKAARNKGFDVVPVPGVSALTCAISVSGIFVDSISFHGFLPAKNTQRIRKLQQLARGGQCYVFYEAPHRIERSLKDMSEAFGAATIACIGKELTKVHEMIRTGTLCELADWISQRPELQKGEFVVIVDNTGFALENSPEIQDAALRKLLENTSPSSAAALAAELLGGRKNQLYQRAVHLAQEQDDENISK